MTASILNFNPPVIAHRGASAYAPENTMSAFVKAAQMGVKWIEFDVMQAACGEPIIFHDETLDRTTNGTGSVIHYPYHYLRSLDAGSWFDPRFAGEKIPNLQQVIEYLKCTQMGVNIEIKALPHHEEALILRVLEELAGYIKHARAPILFSSFSMTALELLHKYAPHQCLGLLMHDYYPEWENYCENLQCQTVNVNHEILTIELAQRIKQLGRKILCYTVNNKERAIELYTMGVDAIFSDIPDKVFGMI